MKRETAFAGAFLALGIGINAIPIIARKIAPTSGRLTRLTEENAAYLDFTVSTVGANGLFLNVTYPSSWIPGTPFLEGKLIRGSYRNTGPVSMNFMARVVEQVGDFFVCSEPQQYTLAPQESKEFWLPPNYPLGDYPVMRTYNWKLRLELRAYY